MTSYSSPVEIEVCQEVLYLRGCLTVRTLSRFSLAIKDLGNVSKINAGGVSFMDTYGAKFLADLLERTGLGLDDVEGLDERFVELLKLVSEKAFYCPQKRKRGLLYGFVLAVDRKVKEYLSFFDFVGRIFVEGFSRISDFEPRVFFKDIENMGLKGLPLIGTLSFLIGVVIAYQSATQLARFGASIFVVDLVVLSMLRELSPLIVAVLLSGRSASSYTASLGLMKVGDELEVLEVMGVSPYAALVIPKVLSLVLISPLLVVFADGVGIFGGMVVADLALGVDFVQFVKRAEAVILPNHFWAGVIKGPVFGFFIALVGAWKGFMVEKRSESIGFRVIESVVSSLFGVLVIDAAFSVVFRWLGI